jgi:hypothetical protein
MPVRTGAGTCVIRTGGYASLPAEGTRVHPVTHAAHIATLRTSTPQECVNFANGASDYCFVGIQWTETGWEVRTPGSMTDQFLLMALRPFNLDLAQNNVPRRISFHQCIGMGNPGGQSNRWALIIAKEYLFRDCWGEDFKSTNREAQVFLLQHGGGYGQFENCDLNAAGECIMTGGSALPFNDRTMIPTDLYFKHCVFRGKFEFFKWHPSFDPPVPASPNIDWGFKNLWEVKRGIRVLCDGCVFHTGGIDGQSGCMIAVKSDNNSTTNPAQSVNATEDIQFIRCWGFDIQRSFALLGNPSPSQGGIRSIRVHVLDCVMERLNVPPNNSSATYEIEITTNIADVTVDHLTEVSRGGASQAGCVLVGPATNPTVTNSIFATQGTYGMKGSNFNEGIPSINGWWVNPTIDRNVLVGGSSSTNYPPTQYFPANEAAVGYVDLNGGTLLGLALDPSSPYYNAATDGGPIGADVAAVAARVAGVLTGTPTG